MSRGVGPPNSRAGADGAIEVAPLRDAALVPLMLVYGAASLL
jgi:hypothetical protein